MSCNVDAFYADLGIVYNKYEIWLSDELISDITAIIRIGQGAAAIRDALVAYGALESSTPPGVGLLIAGFIEIEMGLIDLRNNGCGVKITLWVADVGAQKIPFQWIEPQ